MNMKYINKVNSYHMQFNSFTKIILNDGIVFKNNIPIEYVKNVKYYTENVTGTFIKKDFRWSFNNNYWSAWTLLNQTNFSNIVLNNNRYLFLEIRYQPSNSNSNVISFVVNYDKVEGCSNICDNTIPPINVSVNNNIITDTKTIYKTITVADADTLDGQHGSYYLLRSNQKGTQPISTIQGLTQILNNLDPTNISAFMAATDASFIRIDGSINALFQQDQNIMLYIDGSLLLRDSSITKLFNTTLILDNSLAILDASALKGAYNLGNGANVFDSINNNILSFRSIISGSPNIIIDQSLNVISIAMNDASISAQYWSDHTPISASVGGLLPDATLYGFSSIQILEEMLYEYKNPNITLWSIPPAIVYEKDSSTTYIPDVSIYATFNNDPFKKIEITKAELWKKGYYYLGSTILYPNVSNGSYFFWDPAGVTGTDAWEDCEYQLKLYNTAEGNNYISDASIEFTFVHPYYWGTLDKTKNFNNITYQDIIDLNKLLVNNQTNTITYNVDTSLQNVKFVYAVPDEYNYLNAIYDLRNNFNVLNSFDVSIMNLLAPNGHMVPYKIYLKTQWIDISDFSYTLKYNI